jgi:hypothetical protein
LIGEHRTDPYIFIVLIGRAPLFDHIRAEARPLIDAKDTLHSANDAADHATNNCPDGTCCPFPISGTPLNAARDALGLACNGKQYGDRDSGGADKTADHGDSLIEGRSKPSSERGIGSRNSVECVGCESTASAIDQRGLPRLQRLGGGLCVRLDLPPHALSILRELLDVRAGFDR